MAAMTAEITWCQWLLKDDDEAIEKYIADGWDIRVVDSHHGHYSVLAVKEEKPDERTL